MMPSCNSLNDSCIGRATHLVLLGPMPHATVICTLVSMDTILYQTFCTDMCNMTQPVHDSRMKYRYQNVVYCTSTILYNFVSLSHCTK